MRKSLALLFAFALAARLPAQEVLQNSDFSDGTTHWHGNCKPASSAMSQDFTSTSGSGANGMLVELHSSGWTRVTQEIIDDKAAVHGGMMLTITYQVSPDFQLSNKPSDSSHEFDMDTGGGQVYGRAGEVLAFVDVPPPQRVTTAAPVNGYTQVTIHADSMFSAGLVPSPEQKPQTFTVKINGAPPPIRDAHQTFGLIFPPGSGSITFTKISITPDPNATGRNPWMNGQPRSYPQ